MTDKELLDLQRDICTLRDKVAGLQRIADRKTDNYTTQHNERRAIFHNGRAEACKDVIKLMENMVKPVDIPEETSD